MKNSERFLNAFITIEDFLREEIDANNYVTFYQLIDKATRSNSAVRSYKDDLKEYADLRNAIVHERSGGNIIAEPNDYVVDRIERIVTMLERPPKVIPEFQMKVTTIKNSDSIAKALKLILEQSFSQVPVLKESKFIALLTANTITRWLGASVAEDVFNLSETTVEKVLTFAEDEKNYLFIRRDTTMFEALELFGKSEEQGKHLDALLITQRGKPTEKIIGIITVSDLPTIFQALG